MYKVIDLLSIFMMLQQIQTLAHTVTELSHTIYTTNRTEKMIITIIIDGMKQIT